MIYGYARVSASGQDHMAQSEELTVAGCEKIFTEKASAAHGSKRPQLAKVMAALAAGDVLVVCRLNRLARSARDALNTIAAVKDRGADFRSLREAWSDTTTAHGRLMTTIFSGLAEFDREMILERTGEGRRNARARGVRFGRPFLLTREQEEFVRRERNTIPPRSLSELQKLLGVSRSTISRVAARAATADAKATMPAAALTVLGAHWPTCAILTSGLGVERRCNCGAKLHQVDIEEVTGARPPPGRHKP